MEKLRNFECAIGHKSVHKSVHESARLLRTRRLVSREIGNGAYTASSTSNASFYVASRSARLSCSTGNLLTANKLTTVANKLQHNIFASKSAAFEISERRKYKNTKHGRRSTLRHCYGADYYSEKSPHADLFISSTALSSQHYDSLSISTLSLAPHSINASRNWCDSWHADDQHLQMTSSVNGCRFLMTSRMVLTSIQLLSRMIEYSKNKTRHSLLAHAHLLLRNPGVFTELQQPIEEKKGEEESQIFKGFDPIDYCSMKRLTLGREARLAAQSKPELRRSSGIQSLNRYLLTLSNFSWGLTTQERLDLCRQVWYIRCDEGRVVVRQGQHGNYLYLILSGSVMVQVELEGSPPVMDGILQPGSSFGEVALIGESCKRSATVICREACELLQIDKDTFQALCLRPFQQAIDKKMQVLRWLPPIRRMGKDVLKEMAMQSQLKCCPMNILLYKPYDVIPRIFFIIKDLRILANIDEYILVSGGATVLTSTKDTVLRHVLGLDMYLQNYIPPIVANDARAFKQFQIERKWQASKKMFISEDKLRKVELFQPQEQCVNV